MTALTILRENTEIEDTGVSLRPWKQAEFQQALALGWFGTEPMEYKEGHVFSKRTLLEWQWTRERFYEADDLGWFIGERVERIKGEVSRKVRQNPPHSSVISRLHRRAERHAHKTCEI
jgi:hypothetical protein